MTQPTYIPDFLQPALATTLYETLRRDLAWVRRENVRRDEYWTNTFDRPYTYGSGIGARTYEAQPANDSIDLVNRLTTTRCSCDLFEGCFLNWYGDGNDGLGYHADDDPGIDHSRPIAVVTLYAVPNPLYPRDIMWRSQEKDAMPERQRLANGSLFVMPPGMQSTHFHKIPTVRGDPKITALTVPRMSLTFRGLKSQKTT